MQSKKNIYIFIFLIWLLLVGCEKNKQQITADADKNYSIADTSNDVYSTDHFNMNCKWNCRYTASDGKEIVYIDGDNLYRFSDKQLILQDVCIVNMIYTDNYLYILDDSHILYIVDMNSLDTYTLSDVREMEYDKTYMFFKQESSYKIFRADEKNIIKDGEVINFDEMEIVEGATNVTRNIFGDDNAQYWVNCVRKETGIHKKTFDASGEYQQVIKLDDIYEISANNLSLDDSNTYILYQIYLGKTKYMGEQKDTCCDGILSLDFENETYDTVYETENNLTRIVGFDSDENVVYLYDVNSYRIHALDLGTNQQTTICTLEKKYNSLVFEMSKDVLFIYTDNNELVQIVELKK